MSLWRSSGSAASGAGAASASASAASSSSGSLVQSKGGDERKTSAPVDVHQVEVDLQRAFDGLGSPVSSDSDRQTAAAVSASLMFGEILFAGVSRIFDAEHLDGAHATTMYDLGSGCGRLCAQVFMQFRNLEKVVGVELTSVRSRVGFTAVSRMAKQPPKSLEGPVELAVTERPYTQYALTVKSPYGRPAVRSMQLRQMNLFECTDAWQADILIAETNIPESMQLNFLHFLSNCKPGCRLLTYNNLEVVYEEVCQSIERLQRYEHKASNGSQLTKPPFPWKRLAINDLQDRFQASWGLIRFHLFTCTRTRQTSISSPASAYSTSRVSQVSSQGTTISGSGSDDSVSP